MAVCELSFGPGFKGSREGSSDTTTTRTGLGPAATAVRRTAPTRLMSDVLLNLSRQIVTPQCDVRMAPTAADEEGWGGPGLTIEALPPAPEWSLLPGLEQYQGRRYHKSIKMATRLLPCWHHEGFFIAKLKKRR